MGEPGVVKLVVIPTAQTAADNLKAKRMRDQKAQTERDIARAGGMKSACGNEAFEVTRLCVELTAARITQLQTPGSRRPRVKDVAVSLCKALAARARAAGNRDIPWGVPRLVTRRLDAAIGWLGIHYRLERETLKALVDAAMEQPQAEAGDAVSEPDSSASPYSEEGGSSDVGEAAAGDAFGAEAFELW